MVIFSLDQSMILSIKCQNTVNSSLNNYLRVISSNFSLYPTKSPKSKDLDLIYNCFAFEKQGCLLEK